MNHNLFFQLIQECRHNSQAARLSQRLRLNIEKLSLIDRQTLVVRKANGSPPLWIAAQRGCDAIIEYLLTVCNAPLEQHGELRINSVRHHAPALWIAAVSGHLTTCTLLLESGADVESYSRSQSTALRSCLFCGRGNVARLLLARGADPNAADINYSTPLINATQSASLCALLLAAGAQVNRSDVWGRSALHHAVAEGRLDSVSLLLAAGADAKLKGPEGDDALRLAAIKGQAKIVKMLINRVKHTMKEIADAYNLLGCYFLLEHQNVSTALHWWQKGIDCAPFVPLNPPLPNPGLNYDHITPTHRLMQLYEPERMVKEISANLHGPDAREFMPLYAVRLTYGILGSKHSVTIARIMERGRRELDYGSISQCLKKWLWALHLRVNRDTLLSSAPVPCIFAIIRLLDKWAQSKFKDYMALFKIITDALPEACKLMEVRPRCQRQAWSVDTAMNTTVYLLDKLIKLSENADHKKELLLRVAKLESHKISSPRSGDSLLHMATRAKSIVGIRYLLDAGANPNSRNYHRATALHAVQCCMGRHEKDPFIMHMLLKGGVHCDTPNLWGELPRCQRNRSDVITSMTSIRSLACLAAHAVVASNIKIPWLFDTLRQFLDLHRR